MPSNGIKILVVLLVVLIILLIIGIVICLVLGKKSCDTGYTYDKNTNKCVKSVPIVPVCPQGYTYDKVKNQCVPPSCPTGYYYDPQLKKCEPSIPIVPICPQGYTYNKSENQCVPPSCPTGYHYDPTLKKCVINPVITSTCGSPPAPGDCGDWAVGSDGKTCVPTYCNSLTGSDNCTQCESTDDCVQIGVDVCRRGIGFSDIDTDVHLGRSTFYGNTPAGACGSGMAPNCSDSWDWDPTNNFYYPCQLMKAKWPDLTHFPGGKYFAPEGRRYIQQINNTNNPFDYSNGTTYFSCGECYKITKLLKGGVTSTKTAVVSVQDSCPATANAAWCAGKYSHCNRQGDDGYGEAGSHCKYLDPPPGYDPDVDSHFDLSAVTAGRMGNDPDNLDYDSIINTTYQRVPCPVKGNIHILLANGTSKYYLNFGVLNVCGAGGIKAVEIQGSDGYCDDQPGGHDQPATTGWIPCIQDCNFSVARPQERSGRWGPDHAWLQANTGSKGYCLKLPISIRFTRIDGDVLTVNNVITENNVGSSWDVDSSGNITNLICTKNKYGGIGQWCCSQYGYIDTGAQFPICTL